MSKVVVVGKDELIRKFRAMSEEMQGMSLARAAQAGSLDILNAAKDNVKKNGLMRTRTLSRSLHTEISMNGPNMAIAETGTNLEYAALHEFGGTVTAKKAKYLAIPVGSYKDSPRKHPRLKLRKTVKGNLILISPSGQVQYVLKTSVTVPAQPYLRPAMDEHKQDAIETMEKAFKQIVMKAAG